MIIIAGVLIGVYVLFRWVIPSLIRTATVVLLRSAVGHAEKEIRKNLDQIPQEVLVAARSRRPIEAIGWNPHTKRAMLVPPLDMSSKPLDPTVN